MLIGGAFGGRQGMIMAFMFASVMNIFSYWFSDKIVLRMYRAQEVSEADAPVLYSVTRDNAMKMNMPMPKVYIIPSDALTHLLPDAAPIMRQLRRPRAFCGC